MYDMYLGVPQVFGKVDVEVKFGPFPEHTKKNQSFHGCEIFQEKQKDHRRTEREQERKRNHSRDMSQLQPPANTEKEE